MPESLCLLAIDLHQATPIRCPNRNAPSACAWRRIIAERPIADVEIEFFGQISWLRVRCKINDPQIWLRIGIYRLRNRGDEGELFAIRTERETAHVHFD